MSSAFVFAVCGNREYTEELDYSLRALRCVSKARIIVVTDSTRNEQRIEWADVIDVRTPAELDDHQASIYLKTSLHRLLPTGPRYCYVDADIVALRPQVDDIFQQQIGPVTFANDHVSLSEFSPYALHCGCLERRDKEVAELDGMLAVTARASRFSRVLARVPYLNTELKHALRQLARWSYDPVRQRWRNPDGQEVHTLHCNHLVELIRLQFGIQITDSAWRHWNGGVFVFDSSSAQFLEAWHRRTLAIFTDPAWRTRDQGTLAATAWEFGLQDAPVLRKEFNFIVDYFQDGKLAISCDGSQITDETSSAFITPALIHVFHHFGDTTWAIWNWLDKQVEDNAAAGKQAVV